VKLFDAPRDFAVRTIRHPLGFIGVNLATLSGILLAVLLLSSLLGVEANPYIGAVAYLVLPALFIVGLILIPIGTWRYRKRQAVGPLFPVYDFNTPKLRNRLVLIGVLTSLNLTILAAASYKGIEHLDSVEFCGGTCHPVMKPELMAYEASPHSRVRCVDCHIGPGASWFVQSKLSGTRQVFKQILGTWPRPVETPVHNLRPSRDTCEQCHWPEKFHGDRVRVKTHYQTDSTNTALKTVLLLKVGGGHREVTEERGIHWHVRNKVYYRSDEKRVYIPWVRVERLDGTSTEYVMGDGELPDSIAERPVRLMDCVDCHNRPTHIYRLPDRALDEAMERGQLPADLPYLRREAMAAITSEYPDEETAHSEIRSRLTDFYAGSFPNLMAARNDDLDDAIDAILEIWSRNVHPEMNVTWGTYPDHIGHEDFPGCFRCHDEEHEAEDGSVISQDCSTCHSLLAIEEEEPEVLQMLFE